MRTFGLALLMAVLLTPLAGAGIVNNSGSLAEDSISVAFQLLDSIANPVRVASGDSGWMFVFYPSGALAAKDSCRLTSDAKIVTRNLTTLGRALGFYSYQNSVTNLIGTAKNGTYKYAWIAWDSSINLATTVNGEFQVLTAGDYSAEIDSLVKETTLHRTLDVSSTGEAGLDWANIGSPTTAQNLSATEIRRVDTAFTIPAAQRGLVADSVWNKGFGASFAAGSLGDSLNNVSYVGATDWAHVLNPTTAVNLSATEIRRADSAMSVANIASTDTLTTILGDVTGKVLGGGASSLGSSPGVVATLDNDTLKTIFNKIYNDSIFRAVQADSTKKLLQAVAAQIKIAPGATIRFVTKSGNDANSGKSWETAYLTLRKALFADKTADAGPFYVFVGPGFYNECDTVSFDNTHLVGAGPEQTIFSPPAATNLATIEINSTTASTDHTNFCEIAGIGVAGISQAANNIGIKGTLSDSLSIHDCAFTILDKAIALTGTSFRIYNNMIRYCDQDGIYLNTTKDATVYNNFVLCDSIGTGGTASTGTDGISAGKHSFIAANYVADSSGAGGSAIGEAGLANNAWRSAFLGNFGAQRVIDTPNFTFPFRRSYVAQSNWAGNFGNSRIPYWMTPGGAANYSQDSTGDLSLGIWYASRGSDTTVAHAPHGNNWATSGGGGAGNDSLQIRRWVWDSTSWRYHEPGGGRYKRTVDTLLETLAECGGGSGAFPCTLYVFESPGGVMALQGVFLRVFNSTQTATAATGTTDANGRAIFSLDVAVYKVYGYQGGYAFNPQPLTVTVTASGANDTLLATPYNPGAPATPDLCRVYGWVSDLSGDQIAQASVHARISESPLRFQNLIISPYERVTSTDTTGYWYLDLFPSSDLNPSTTRYEFEIRFTSGAILRRKVAVPDSTQWFFTW